MTSKMIGWFLLYCAAVIMLVSCASSPVTSHYVIGISKTDFYTTECSNGFSTAVLGLSLFSGKYYGAGIGLNRTVIREVKLNEQEIIEKERKLINSIMLKAYENNNLCNTL